MAVRSTETCSSGLIDGMMKPSSAKVGHPPEPRPLGHRTKEPAHLPLHRRLLFPTYPVDKPLPPIIISSSKSDDISIINERLYHLIALALRAYVLSWYPRFSKDKSFLPTVSLRIIIPLLSPILTGLYTDPDRLVFFLLADLPNILVIHWKTYWQSRQALRSFPHLYPVEDRRLDGVYHARLPLLSVIPSPGVPEIPADGETPYRRPIPPGQYTLSPLYLTSLSDALLRPHLPPEEYGCEVERIMAKEIIGRTVLGAVGRKLGEGWFWWTLGLKLLGSDSSEMEAPEREQKTRRGRIDIAWQILLGIWNLAILAWSTLVWTMARYSAAPPTSARYNNCMKPWLDLTREILGVDGRSDPIPRRWALSLAWGTIEAILIILQPFIDRLLPHLVRSHLTRHTALRLIDLSERLLFPLDGYPGPSPPDLTDTEAESARSAFEERLKQIIPRQVQGILFPSSNDIRYLLDPLADPGCNAHLVAILMDGIVAAVEPSLAVSASATVNHEHDGEKVTTAQYPGRSEDEQVVQAPNIDIP